MFSVYLNDITVYVFFPIIFLTMDHNSVIIIQFNYLRSWKGLRHFPYSPLLFVVDFVLCRPDD